jgi:hypothetical protein
MKTIYIDNKKYTYKTYPAGEEEPNFPRTPDTEKTEQDNIPEYEKQGRGSDEEANYPD